MSASANAVRFGRAFIELFADSTRLEQGLRSAQAKIRMFGQEVGRVGSVMFRLGLASSAAFVPMVKAASDAVEINNKFAATFRDQADAAEKFIDRIGEAVGRSSIKLKDSMSAFQALFTGMGFDPAVSREMSQTMQGLALDFASFHNLTDDDANRRMIAALSGSVEVLDRYGVNLKIAALDQELMARGISKGVKGASEQEKTVARLATIMKAMSAQGAVGDAIRTQGEFANMTRRLKDELHDLMVEIGNALLPALNEMQHALVPLIEDAGKWVAANGETIRLLAKVSVGFLGFGIVLIGVSKMLLLVSWTLGMVNTLLKITVTNLRIFGVVLAGLAIMKVASEVYQMSGAIRDLNNELARSKELNDAISGKRTAEQEETLKRIADAPPEKRQAIIDEELSKAQKNEQGLKARRDAVRREIADREHSDFGHDAIEGITGRRPAPDSGLPSWEKITGNKILGTRREELAELEASAKAAEEHRIALEKLKARGGSGAAGEEMPVDFRDYDLGGLQDFFDAAIADEKDPAKKKKKNSRAFDRIGDLEVGTQDSIDFIRESLGFKKGPETAEVKAIKDVGDTLREARDSLIEIERRFKDAPTIQEGK